ncbi:MAG: MarR family transcriptional regulator [Blastopirellula sp.]|nr:MAG: MarR family transcriptional regulator [Blastopirellula sp.]
MARKASQTLTDGELRLMQVIWRLGSATVRDVVVELEKKDKVAYNTVQTMLRILEEKGYLSHEKLGRSFVYSPIVERQNARSAALKKLLANFFDDSPQSLLVNLIEDEELDVADIQKLKGLISQSK